MVFNVTQSKKMFAEGEKGEPLELETLEDLRTYLANLGEYEALIIFDDSREQVQAKPKPKGAVKAKTTVKPKIVAKPTAKTARKK